MKAETVFEDVYLLLNRTIHIERETVASEIRKVIKSKSDGTLFDFGTKQQVRVLPKEADS